MSPVNKYEAVGIFISVAVVALVLAAIRFQSDTFAVFKSVNTENQGSLITAANNEEESLAQSLRDNMTTEGELKKLIIDDVRLGIGDTAREGDTVTVHYIGTTRDGVQFDNSYVRGEPFSFTIGDGKVIKGWEEGLVGMKVGGQRMLVIPPLMAYGNLQVGPIPANSVLVFSIELLEIK